MSGTIWVLTSYPNVIEDFRKACGNDKKMLASLEDCLYTLLDKGPSCGEPRSKYLEDGIYEIRPKTHERQGRILYSVNLDQKKITFLNWFFKTTRKTPRKHLDLAKKRHGELKNPKKGGAHG